MRRLIGIQPGEKMGNFLHICWMLHNMCNQRCTYCRDFNWNGDFRWLKYDHVESFLRRVFTHYKKDLYHISFTGGEVTLWPEFPKLVKFLKANDCQLGLTTNGSRRLDYWKAIENDFNWMCISYHAEYAKDDHLLDLVRLLVNKTRLSVRLMMHKEKKYWDQCLAFGEKLKALTGCKHLFVEYVPLQDDFGMGARPTEYADWQQEFFKEKAFFTNESAPDMPWPDLGPEVWDFQARYSDDTSEFCRPNELVRRNEINFKDWSCYAGVDMLFINQEGEIFRGGCRQGGKVGHIFDEVLNFPVKPWRCTTNFCPCGTDILTKKFAPELHP